MLYYFKKVKMHLKQKKICAVYGEGAVTDPNVKSGLQNFVQISWTMREISQVNQLKLTVIKSRHQLRIININHTGESRHTQNIKIKCWKKLHQFGYVNSFDVWVPHKLSRKSVLDHTSICNSLLKCRGNILFLKQGCDRQWKVHTLLQWCEWKRSWSK